jgi:hypothetical protein
MLNTSGFSGEDWRRRATHQLASPEGEEASSCAKHWGFKQESPGPARAFAGSGKEDPL